ncbi:glycosyltransferase family 4 protein [Mycobacterium sp. M1]|uniref:Glycosyltransferase family 4 protein n=1 Tax=Mycolicibacter acidiphilus TaxID=2835306 RepID=A0ABS5RGU2_9MYCO|nr:glycosyltransferase family 4 protein [Mycolicibacter acidiphilus]MBS9533515.1 glycosyltransferase family 4 protein [Mycolicibacter acidiphilus]
MTPQRNRLRVLVVGPAPAGAASRGGMATVITLMAAHPSPRLHITVVPTYTEGSIWQRLRLSIPGMLRAAGLVLSGHIDLLHVHLAHGGSVIRKSLPLCAARLAGVPAVVHGHSYDFGGWFDSLPATAQRIVRLMLPADHLVVLGQRHIEEYASRLRVPSERISVLHNAVRIPDVPLYQADVERVHVVALGRLGGRKGSYDLVDAVAGLPENVRNRLRVTLAGDGEVDEVRAAVAAASLGETIHVAGWLGPEARDELLSSAHVFALPSFDEGLPMALLEAMAAGLAPVVTLVGSIGEAVTDRVNGLTVAPGHPEQIGEALGVLVADQDLRARLAEKARSRATDFGVEAWYQRLEQLWTGLTGAANSDGSAAAEQKGREQCQ